MAGFLSRIQGKGETMTVSLAHSETPRGQDPSAWEQCGEALIRLRTK